MLDHNNDFSISGGTFKLTDNRIFNVNNGSHTTYIGAKGGFDLLWEQVAHRAPHNSGERFDAPKCHPHTRVAVLERVMEWIWGRDDRDALIMWLYGPAGAGKSSIAQSIAEKCHELGLLLASFFFSESDESRNTFFHLVPTLAYQIALHIPEARESIAAAISHDPLVSMKSLSTQIELLLIRPLRPLIDSGYFSDPNSRRLIIIDGLDECHDSNVQQNIVEKISNALRDRKVPLIFLIASRPEVHLCLTFNLPIQTPILTRLALDDNYKPEEDIRIYLKDSFEQIVSTHPRKGFFPSLWPSPDQIQLLVDKASGQFIYAATVVKYVESLQHSPVDRLEVILGLHPPHNDRPFAELDALYDQIFYALDKPSPVLQILGVRNIGSLDSSGFYWLSSIDSASCFLSLKPSDVFGHMSNISALVTLKTDPDSRYTTIHIHHKSLMEFLEDPSRAGMFYLDPRISAAKVVHGYLRIIQDERLANDLWQLPERENAMYYIRLSLEQLCGSAGMTRELHVALMRLSVPKFIDFYLRLPGVGGLDRACEVLEGLGNLFLDEIDKPDHQPSLRKHLLNLLEPYFSHPRLTSLWILAVDPWNMCCSCASRPRLSELLQLDESLCEMDKTNFRFDYISLEFARSRCQRLKSIMPSTITEKKGTILATLALHFLEYICQQKLPQGARRRKTDQEARMIRKAPWRWRQRFMAIKPFWSKSDQVCDDTRPEVPKWCFGILRCHDPDIVYERDSTFSELIYSLDHLPTLLKHAAKNDDLITFASRCIFPPQVFRFPRLRKRAQKAVNAYLAKYPANAPAIPPPEDFEVPNDERFEHKSGGPWYRIFDLFPHFLAFLVYIYFLWITFFA